MTPLQSQFETYKDEKGEWRWRVRAANGEIVIPPESHTREADARRAIDDARKVLAEAAPEDVPIIVKAVER